MFEEVKNLELCAGEKSLGSRETLLPVPPRM